MARLRRRTILHRNRARLRPPLAALRSSEVRPVSQGALIPAHTKAVFLGDIAKYEGQTVTEFFAVAQKQFSRKRDGAAYLSLRADRPHRSMRSEDVGQLRGLRGYVSGGRYC